MHVKNKVETLTSILRILQNSEFPVMSVVPQGVCVHPLLAWITGASLRYDTYQPITLNTSHRLLHKFIKI